MSDPNCPSRDDLLAYAVGKLADDASEAIDAHLDTCPNCQSALETLHDAHDSLVAGLRPSRGGRAVP